MQSLFNRKGRSITAARGKLEDIDLLLAEAKQYIVEELNKEGAGPSTIVGITVSQTDEDEDVHFRTAGLG
jgi:hypothetical protein